MDAMNRIAILSIIITISYQSHGFAADRCENVLTSAVRQKVAIFKGYDLPSEYDNRSENIDYDVQHGGSGCLGAVNADFDGDGMLDTAVLLRKRHDADKTILVVVPGASRLRPQRLYTFVDVPRTKLALSVLEPGSYERAGGLDNKLEHGEVRRVQSLRDAIGAGVIDSS